MNLSTGRFAHHHDEQKKTSPERVKELMEYGQRLIEDSNKG